MVDSQEISDNLAEMFGPGNFLTRLNFRFFTIISGLNKFNRDSKILDCGCATGFLLEHLMSLGFGDADGIEASPEMAEEAKKRTQGKVYLGDVVDIPNFIEADSYDVVIASGLIHHLTTLDDWQRFFAGCRHALKPGGALIIREPHPTLIHNCLDGMSRYKAFHIGSLAPRLKSFREEEALLEHFFSHWLKGYKEILASHGFHIVKDNVWLVHKIITTEMTP